MLSERVCVTAARFLCLEEQNKEFRSGQTESKGRGGWFVLIMDKPQPPPAAIDDQTTIELFDVKVFDGLAPQITTHEQRGVALATAESSFSIVSAAWWVATLHHAQII